MPKEFHCGSLLRVILLDQDDKNHRDVLFVAIYLDVKILSVKLFLLFFGGTVSNCLCVENLKFTLSVLTYLDASTKGEWCRFFTNPNRCF